MDILLYSGIAMMINFVAHHITSMSYRDLPFEERQNRSMVMLIILGLAIMILEKTLLQEDKYNNPAVNKGLLIGGLLLIGTGILTNWSNMVDEMRLFISGLCLGGLIYYAYNRDKF